MTYLQFAISVGACIGPLLGGYTANRFFFSTFNFSVPFFIAAVLAAINTLFTAYCLRETYPEHATQPTRATTWTAIKTVIAHPDVLRISFILLLIQFSWSTYYQFISPILKTLYHFDAQQLGKFVSLIAFWLALATALGIKLLPSFPDPRRILMYSLLLMFTGFILTLLISMDIVSHHLLLWISALPIAAGDVIAYSCLSALYSNIVTQGKQGKVMGVNFIIVSLAWALSGFIGGFLLGISPLLLLSIAPLGVVVASILMFADFGKRITVAHDLATATTE